MTIQEKLIELSACWEASDWAGNKTLPEIWATCERGDWMLWLMKRANMCNLHTLTDAKARCAKLSQPWIKESRSIAALQAAFDFKNGLIGEDQLAAAAADAASDAAYFYASAAAYAAAYDYAHDSPSASAYEAAEAAAASASAAAVAAASAYNYASAAAVAAAKKARQEILKKCADICREVLPNPQIEDVE